jgi:acetyltransferase-like isoleucine patch superfamily enzyme
MPNKIIGKFLYDLIKIKDYVFDNLRNHLTYYIINKIEPPFYIGKDVEFRNSHQIDIKRECTIKSRCIINGRSNSKEYGIMFGENTYLKENCNFDAYNGFIHIDGCCAFGQNTIIHGGGGVKIGKYVITGANCYIISSNHKYDSKEYPIVLQGDTRKGITIEENVWLGGNVIVLDGVRIGKNSVIAAGTIITKDIPQNTLAYDKIDLQKKGIYK